MDYGAEKIQFVEVDQPLCTRTFGASPCMALLGVTGRRKCRNTRATCHDPEHYVETTLVLRFTRNQEGLLEYGPFIPSVSDEVRTAPGRINLGSMDDGQSSLGQREVVTVQMTDHLHSDFRTDPYRLERHEGLAVDPALAFDFVISPSLTPVFGTATLAVARSAATATRVNELGLIAAVSADTPRFDYDPVTLLAKGALIEEARTNLCLRSEDIVTTWTNLASSETANATASPDGAVTADKIVEDGTTATHGMRQAITITANGTYTFSVFAKAAERTAVNLVFWDLGANGVRCNFNLTSGTAGTPTNFGTGSGAAAMIEPYANGFYRCSLSGAIGSGVTAADVDVRMQSPLGTDSYAGNGTSGLYQWGAMLEAGGFRTSYISTAASAVLRNADVFTIATLGSWFSASAGTMLYEALQPALTNTFCDLAAFTDASLNERIDLAFNASAGVAALGRLTVSDGGVTQADIVGSNGTLTAGVVHRAAASYSLNSFALAANGVSVGTDSAGTLPSPTKLELGCRLGGNQLNGHLRRFAYYSSSLSSADLLLVSNNMEAGAAYDPYDRGTFWGKWLAANPYRQAYRARVLEGANGDAEAALRIRNYFVDSVELQNGMVSLTLKDFLAAVQAQKAVAPVASNGRLSADINSAVTAATLAPSGIGNLEYPASGYLRIGDEVVSFTRSADALTIARAQLGTAAAAHSADDRAQLVLAYVAQAGQAIAKDLLTTFTTLDAGDIDPNWDTASASLVHLFTAYITEPTSVEDLIGELCQQVGFTVWPDVVAGFVSIAPLAGNAPGATVTDNEWIEQNSLSVKTQINKRVSQVWVHYGLYDPTMRLEADSFRSTAITADAEAEALYGSPSIKEIFSRWIDSTGRSFALEIGERIRQMFRDPPREAKFTVRAERSESFGLARAFALQTDAIQDFTGTPLNKAHVAIEVERGEDEFKIKSQELTINTPDPNAERIIYIDHSVNNLNLRASHDAQYAAPTGVETVTFVLGVGVVVGSASASTYALDTGDWPAGVALKLVNHGRGQGKGGDGGIGGYSYQDEADTLFVDGVSGTAGGDVLRATYPISVDNTDGQLWAGGGGGGGGCGGYAGGGATLGGGGGGGGAGTNVGIGGPPGPSFPINVAPGTLGANSTADAAGSPGTGAHSTSIPGAGPAQPGGAGGAPGVAGSAGSPAVGGLPSSPGAGGTFGRYVVGNSFVTWLANGDRRGGVA